MADSQFSALGLVMLAELARTKKAIGLPDSDNEDAFSRTSVGADGTATVEDVGEALVRPLDHGGLESLTMDRAAAPPGQLSNAPTPELEGYRAYIPNMTSSSQPADPTSILPSRNTIPSGLAKKKKRRNFNPIDDMFKGLT